MPQSVSLIPSVVASALVGAVITWLLLRGKHLALLTRLEERTRETALLREEVGASRNALGEIGRERARLVATVEAERLAAKEKLELVEANEAKLKEAFALLTQEALTQNNRLFLDLAETKFADLQRATQTELATKQQAIDQLVTPVNEGLRLVAERLVAFDKDRVADRSAIQEHLRLVAGAQGQLVTETQVLVRALRSPQVRGQWGELQLQRVVELAGMVEHCDFVQQVTAESDGGRLRPDMLVRLPGEKVVIVDSKAPLSAYLDAMEAGDAERDALLDTHARQVRDHIVALSGKDYANEFSAAPDFVVMFLPGEAFFSAACQRDPNLVDFAIQRGVIPASPTTLITVLKAVAYGWQQERIAKSAEEIRDLGHVLYERIRVVADHLLKMRKGLEAAVGAYNSAVGALECRVLPAARRFRDLGAGNGDEISQLESIDLVPRVTAAAELCVAAA